VAEPRRTDAADPTALVAPLERMAHLYRSLWRLSQRQRRLIETGDTAALMRLLQARQKALDRLAAIQPEVERVVAAWRAGGGDLAPPVRERIRRLLDEIDRVLKRVMAADAEDSQRLSVRRTTVAEHLKRQQQADQAARAYRSASVDEHSGRLDLKDRSE
jgi:hypothetical protein